MAYNLFLLIIVSSMCGVFAQKSYNAPVIFFTAPDNEFTKSYQKAEFPSLQPLKQNDFNRVLQSFDAEATKIFVITENLSPENLKMKTAEGQFAFQHLAKERIIMDYFPVVMTPYSTVLSHDKKAARVSMTVTNDLSDFVDDSKTIIVSWGGCRSDESEENCMQRLDRSIHALSQEYPKAVFCLTSLGNDQLQKIHSRKARDVDGKDNAQVFTHDNLIVVLGSAWEYGNKDPSKTASFKLDSVTPNDIKADSMSVAMKSAKYNIVLDLRLSHGAWSVFGTKVNDKVIYPHTLVSAPYGYSFKCSKSVYYKFNDNTEIDGISLHDIQIQPKFDDATEKLTKFGPAYDCVGFTSPAIWTGIFITFLLLAILSIGITFIMDIRTMDRFDDPKGKTITVTANE